MTKKKQFISKQERTMQTLKAREARISNGQATLKRFKKFVATRKQFGTTTKEIKEKLHMTYGAIDSILRRNPELFLVKVETYYIQLKRTRRIIRVK